MATAGFRRHGAGVAEEGPKGLFLFVIDAHAEMRRQNKFMRDDYIKGALKVVDDPNILVNLVSLRVKQLKRGNRPLVESLEKLSPEDTALREIMEGKISYELATNVEAHGNR